MTAPSIVGQPDLREHLGTGRLRAVFLAPQDEDELLRNFIDRSRGVPDKAHAELRNIARMNWLYTAWLVCQAEERSIPVVTARSWSTLATRTLETL